MPPTRRDVLRYSAFALASGRSGAASEGGVEVNDIHSQLNGTLVARVVRPRSLEQLRAAILQARREGLAVSISGSRHSMGGQQFGTGMVLIDTRDLNRVVALDPAGRTIEAEAGIEWPELLSELARLQTGSESQLGIIQKQTCAHRLSLGGALSSNVHGRGLKLKPIVNDVESFELMDANGDVIRCDRGAHRELFRYAIGGYGLFGVITSVRLRLTPRVKVRRVVKIAGLQEIPDGFDDAPHLHPRGQVRRVVKIAGLQEIPDGFAERIRDGYLYGDFQFATESSRDS